MLDPSESDEVLSGPGFVVVRKGRFVHMRSTLSGEERRTHLQELASREGEIRGFVEQQVRQLEEVLSEYNPLDIIGHVSLANSIVDAESYKEYSHPGSPAYVEYITLLCLTKPYDSYPEHSPDLISGEVVQDIQRRIESLLMNEILYLAVGDVDPECSDKPDMLSELRFRTLVRSTLVRYPAYHHHLIGMLIGLFTPLKDSLEQVLGFNIGDAIGLAEGIERLITGRLSERRTKAQQFAEDLRNATNHYRRNPDGAWEFPTDSLAHLAESTPDEADAQITSMAIAWMLFGLGETLSFSAQELAAEVGLDMRKVVSFLGKFSLEFGHVDPRYRLPSPTHPLMTKPLIRYEDKYFCPVLQLVYCSLYPAIESLLNPQSPASINSDQTVWERYARTRAGYLEEKAIAYLGEALRYADAYRNLKYKVCEIGLEKEMELDGLLMLDSALFLVEAKAGTLSPPARRGAKKRIVEELGELVEEAYSQALRAKQYIEDTDEPSFCLDDGTILKVDKDGIDRIFLITVTLDDLGAYITNLYQLQELGFFSEQDFPWTVSMTDLQVISEIVQFPSQLVHYLQRRTRLNELGFVQAHEELDWFGHYLLEGLYFEDIAKQRDEDSILNLLSYTTMFDDYYLYTTGQRSTPAEKPSQLMPGVMSQFLTELEESHPKGYLKAACALLDMDGRARQDFSANVLMLKEKTLQDQRLHDFTMPFCKSGFGVTCMFALEENASELASRLCTYCRLKKYQMQSHIWVAFGCIVDRPDWVSYLCILDDPWYYDEHMEELVKTHLPPLNPSE